MIDERTNNADLLDTIEVDVWVDEVHIKAEPGVLIYTKERVPVVHKTIDYSQFNKPKRMIGGGLI